MDIAILFSFFLTVSVVKVMSNVQVMRIPVRNLMFHVYFMEKIAKPKGETPDSLLEKY